MKPLIRKQQSIRATKQYRIILFVKGCSELTSIWLNKVDSDVIVGNIQLQATIFSFPIGATTDGAMLEECKIFGDQVAAYRVDSRQ